MSIAPHLGPTARELELVSLVATGLSTKEAAHQLGITPNNARVRLCGLYKRLGVNNVREAALVLSQRPDLADVANRRRAVAIARFHRNYVEGPGCWEWTGTRLPTGYGRATDGHGRYVQASRLSWELANGPIPGGLVVCHACDNPPCVRPDHLFLGTHRDNLADMRAKGRSRNTAAEMWAELRRLREENAQLRRRLDN